ncbi:helix-turn-helix domain-containing protein [Desulfonatronovibrio hydrogenovorans]|uniref:helix-turn-helix domain-containing protein n=1 Tax=Desulfonatronovibrio hydrogenovorans TaxID=53245 RepID=UPI00048E7359|nr:helix-turn-helix transcriptional regulator [Desulfonatronovibrio hydrogenovorans]
MDAERFLAENTFYCSALKCRMTPAACAETRSRPESHEGGFGYTPLKPHACKSCDWEEMQGAESEWSWGPGLTRNWTAPRAHDEPATNQEVEDVEKSIAEKLKEIRGERTKAEMASLTGVHFTVWGKWEKGESRPNYTNMIKIKEKLGVDLGVHEQEYTAQVARPRTEELKTAGGFAELKPSGPTLHIDFSQIPDGQRLFDKIVNEADEQFRTPAMHAAYLLSIHVQGSSEREDGHA